MDGKKEGGTIFVVATPIGNLEDITIRALRVLKECDTVLAEDTRVTRKLLEHYGIAKPVVSCHEHTDERKLNGFVEEMTAGKTYAYVTDAGTPGLSDPGNKLVALSISAGVAAVPIPGPSALGSAVSIAGIDMREFLFLGFPPHKKGRETFFRRIADSDIPVVYYESPHRVVKNLELLAALAPGKRVIIGRELTKMFEEIRRGMIGELLTYYQEHADRVKGEFVVIVH